MHIGILSDTHNHLGNFKKALDRLQDAGIETIIHCGDVTTAKTADLLRAYHFTVHHVLGNVDANPQKLRQTLTGLNPDNSSGLTFTGSFGGVPVAAAHGHVASELEKMITGGRYRYVFHGHTHRRRNDRDGQTRIINPGALGGVRYESRSFVILDLESGHADFIEVADY